MPKKFLTVSDTAAALKISRQRVHQLIKLGKLDLVPRLVKKMLVTSDSVERFQQTRPGKPGRPRKKMSEPIFWRDFYWWLERKAGRHRLWMWREREAQWIESHDFLTDPRPEKNYLRVGDMAVDFRPNERESVETVYVRKILWEPPETPSRISGPLPR